AQLVAHRMLTRGSHLALVNLVRGFGDPSREGGAARPREQIRSGPSRDLPLQPHPESRNACDRLGHRDAVGARGREAVAPELVGEPVVGIPVPARAHLAEHANTPWRDARTLDEQVVLDEAAPA